MKCKILIVISIIFLFSIQQAYATLFSTDFDDPNLTGWVQLADPFDNQVVWVEGPDGGEITARDEYNTPGVNAGYLIEETSAMSLSFEASVRLEQNLHGDNQTDAVAVRIGDPNFNYSYFIYYGFSKDDDTIVGMRFIGPSGWLIDTSVPYDANYHKIKATRDDFGNWNMYFDDIIVGTAIDSQVTDFASVIVGFNNRGGYITTLKFSTDSDSDGDGVTDTDDWCPNTVSDAAVDINGCSIAQLCPVCPVDQWINHGKYVSCVANEAELFYEDGLITEEEKDAIVSEAAKSKVGKKNYDPCDGPGGGF